MGYQLLKGVWWRPEGVRMGSVMQKYGLEFFSKTITVIELDL